MAQNYVYKAKNRSGQFLAGTILAENESAVASYVRDKGYFVINIAPEKSGISLENYLSKFQRITIKEIAILCRQFSTMVDAGLPMVTCLSILIEQIKNPRLKTALKDVYKRVKEGETLSKALSVYPTIFPCIMINMIEAGEMGGVLDEVLGRLATHFEKEYKMNEKVKSALTYPAVVMVVACIAVIIIMTFVMPTFTQLFTNMNVALPLPTRILLGISDLLRNNGVVFLFATVTFILGCIKAYQKETVRKHIDGVVIKLPVVGVIFEKVAVARFTRTLSTLVRSGVPILLALDVVKNTIGNLVMVEELSRAQENIKEGVSLSATLGSSKLFNSMVIQMIAIGEESGALDKMLEKVADFYESDVDDIVSRLSSIIEPVIILGLGTVVGFIVISVIIPMFDLVTGAGK